MKTLDEIAIHFQTDKATQFTRTYAKPKGYTVYYEKFFTPLRDKYIKVLEIGAAGGESIQTWLEYFPDSRVVGVDIVKDTNPWNTEGADTHLRYDFMQGDQASSDFWKAFFERFHDQFDIVIDDGGHYDYQIINSFNALWPKVSPGGFYCIEDLACAYSDIFRTKGTPNPVDMLNGIVDGVLNGQGYEQIHFSKELAIIQKSR